MGGKSLRFPPFMFRITIPRVKTVPVPARNVFVATSGRKIGLKTARNVSCTQSERKNSPVPARNLFVATSGRKIGLKPARNISCTQSGRKTGLKSARNVCSTQSERKIGLNPAQNHRVVILFMPQYKFLLQVLN